MQGMSKIALQLRIHLSQGGRGAGRVAGSDLSGWCGRAKWWECDAAIDAPRREGESCTEVGRDGLAMAGGAVA
jgi:hypothetical protein